MHISFHNFFAVTLAVCFVLAGCLLDSSQSRRGSVVENEVLAGRLFDEEGAPAANAQVRVFPVDHVPNKGLVKTGADTSLVYTFKTDDNGRFTMKDLPIGQYNFLGEKAGLFSYQDSVAITKTTDSIPTDTLKAPGSITGRVALEPNHDPRTVFVQVLGTNAFAVADSQGRFTLSNLASGQYALRLLTTLPDYTPYFGGLRVRSGHADTLNTTIRFTYTGIPVVRGLRAAFDTAAGAVTLSWNRTQYPFFKEYLVYRVEASSLELPMTPYARLRDTFFVDTLSIQDLGVWPSLVEPIRYEYRVRIRNLSDDLGLTFGSVISEAVPAEAVQTQITLSGIDGRVLRASVRDTIAVIVNWTNPTRANDSLLWTGPDGSRLRASGISGREGVDTLRLGLPPGPETYALTATVRDRAGSVWTAVASVDVVLDPPLVRASEDTLVTMGERVNLNGKADQAFGSIVKWEWDIGNTGVFKRTSNSDTSFLAPSKPGEVICRLRATDDDGNTETDQVMVIVVLDVPTADAGRDTTVSLQDTVRLHGRGSDAHGRIMKWEWNVGPGKSFMSVSGGDTAIVSRKSEGYDTLILRVTNAKGNTDSDTLIVVVYDDFPTASLAQGIRQVSEGGGYRLHAKALDLGRIAKYEWSIGTGDHFVLGSGPDTAFVPSKTSAKELVCKVRVTDDDRNSVVVSSIIPVSRWKGVGPTDLVSPLIELDGKPAAYGGNDNPFIFDPDLGKWTQVDFDPGFYGKMVMRVNGKFYSYATDGDWPISGVIQYNPVFHKWMSLTDGPYGLEPRMAAGGRLYFTGRDDNSFMAYDLTSRILIRLASPRGTIKNSSAMAEAGGKIYLLLTDPYDAQWQEYDPINDVWRDKPNPPERFRDASLVNVGGKLYAIGGGSEDWGTLSKHVHMFDPTTEKWLVKSDLLYPVKDRSSAAVDGKIYALGGGMLQVYDPADDP